MNYSGVHLYKKDSKGKTREWVCTLEETLSPEGYCVLTIKHGVTGGAIQTKHRYVKDGKNKGKANETSKEEQALLELTSLYQKQLDSGYVLNIEDYEDPISPVLAHKYKDRRHTIKWKETDGSPLKEKDVNRASKKLNGIRCMVFVDFTQEDPLIYFESRTRKPFKNFHHIAREISLQKETLNKAVFDGELFHPEIPFEIICTLVNSHEYTSVVDPLTGKTWHTEDIQLHCYDLVNLEKKEETFYDRFISFSWSPKTPWESLKLVKSIPILSEEELEEVAREWIQEGHEGLMLRTSNVPYDFGKRSNSLLKYKIMEQDEFLIKDVYLAENDETKVMFRLENKFSKEASYDTFDCAIKGDKKAAMSYYDNRSSYINKSYLTVDYQALSAYKVPLFPVGIIVRKGETLDGVFIPDV